MLRRPYCVIVGTLFLVVASFSIAQVPTEAPDFVLLNGRVFTATEAHPYAEAPLSARPLSISSQKHLGQAPQDDGADQGC